MNSEKIKKLLEKCKRNQYKPDLHSFIADIKGGEVVVNYVSQFNISVIKFGKVEDKREYYRLNLPKAVELLEQLEINLDSVEF